ncbi:MAG: type II toxin-antitoxin system Phd/YefM family antitoxin [Peptococcaceae bacterium]|jgi:prevent-host-death family protein|nr:type II toxin-antitoxin system Phd/YefM family antitoxin [Peptococcaceae bacterium]
MANPLKKTGNPASNERRQPNDYQRALFDQKERKNPMKHITASTVQKDFPNVLDDVTRYNEPVTIVSDDNKVAVLLSMEEWSGIQETLYLQSFPGMVKSIKAAATEPLAEGIDVSEVSFDV